VKNLVAKKYVILLVIFTIFFAVLMAFNIIKQNEYYKQEINLVIFNLVGNIKKEYPNVSEEQILNVLNNKENSKVDGENFLREYGITSQDLTIERLENLKNRNLICNIGILVLFGILVIFVFLVYLINRKKKINELDNYVQNVANKKYYTEIEKESEDELNRLKDSLYKITVVLRENSENVEKQNKAILSSITDISHQLKTPITSIQILLDDIIESEDMDNETKRKFCIEILRQVKGMNFLILALLKLSKIDAGVVEFEKNKINLEELVDDCVSDLEFMKDIKQINIVKSVSNNLQNIYLDYNWTKEAILNILKNAIEYTYERKNVYIDITDNNVYSEIKIRDEGMGISKEDLKHIFERFYKVQNSNENSFGIGLSLSKSIIEKQNGYISVDSEVGNGTTFYIKFMK